MAALVGKTVLVPESRELDLFARMLEAEGAAVLRCPLVQICDLNDTSEAQSWTAKLIAGEFQDVIWLTGEGLRRLLSMAETHGTRDALIAALRNVRSIVRGSKPARVLRELGIAPGLAATAPTSQGVIDVLARENLSNRRIGVQLYPGDGSLPLIAQLHELGALVVPITPYRYASQTETEKVADTIRMAAAGRIDVIAFTSSPQVERLFDVADKTGLRATLCDGLDRCRIAAIGPVVEETLQRHGITKILRPETNFHLKPLVRAIALAEG